ncbi:23S rRNA (adenine(2030)-N(6))-methyltransferase RlmJ [Zhengella mangrovi]|uniref:Ribosomal RNA large subunit methyltransferase J n=1 Tax=Zhengella mangrovi TaxID=1982044 RepID=A0A2G1QT71_9HYPH|nr:23S rRNA (adenine(2030)-N(6))-methyltransferase RlmJ [Zhengella mangrovi]PHP68418.1 23S rRNA (adenine(2030)-N(6))-methyltransferase RlmJ [Zhengella mangrovi]
MNYRHIYHAGNFADVLKHAVLARIVEYLKGKDKAFRVIDTHAGTGLYDLASEEAQKTGEWQGGIGRILDADLPADAKDLLEPLLAAVRAVNPDGGIRRYPGSPLLVRSLLRKQDRLTAIELHPRDAEALRARFAGDYQVRVIELDGWLAPGAQLPPKEKRGLVLIDPPFEKEGEFSRLADALVTGHRRWPGGTFALWYPVKDRKAVAAFRAALKATGIPKILDITLAIRPPSPDQRLDGTGMIVVNPPYTLEREMAVLLPVIGARMAEDGVARTGIEVLAGETA